MKIRHRGICTFWCRIGFATAVAVVLIVNIAFQQHAFQHNPNENNSNQSRSEVTISQDISQPSHNISVNFMGRLGNQLFMFTSLLGIAKTNNLKPVVRSNVAMLKMFKQSVSTYTGKFRHTKNYVEKQGCVFEEKAMHIGSDKDVILNGYFQSWKYFIHIEKYIRQQLQFTDSIFNKAKQIFTKSTKEVPVVDPVYVGVHVRRGDFMSTKIYVDYGYVAAGEEYIRRALTYMRNKYKNVVFLVASDDLPWCKKHLTDKDVTFVEKGNKPEIDMATLTFCNHSIMTTGSFGWWTSFLTGGDTVYYSDYPKPNSALDKRFNKTTYYPRDWVAL